SPIIAPIAAPIFREDAVAHIAMERGIRPVSNSIYEFVFHWVEVNVICMTLEVTLIANRVLPISALPQRDLSVSMTWNWCRRLQDLVCETTFDNAPPIGIICVPVRQCHHHVQVIRQDHDCINRERLGASGLPNRAAQGLDVVSEDV